MPLRFIKVEAGGNDLVLVDARREPVTGRAVACHLPVRPASGSRRGRAVDARRRPARPAADADVQPGRHGGFLRERAAVRRRVPRRPRHGQ